MRVTRTRQARSCRSPARLVRRPGHPGTSPSKPAWHPGCHRGPGRRNSTPGRPGPLSRARVTCRGNGARRRCGLAYAHDLRDLAVGKLVVYQGEHLPLCQRKLAQPVQYCLRFLERLWRAMARPRKTDAVRTMADRGSLSGSPADQRDPRRSRGAIWAAITPWDRLAASQLPQPRRGPDDDAEPPAADIPAVHRGTAEPREHDPAVTSCTACDRAASACLRIAIVAGCCSHSRGIRVGRWPRSPDGTREWVESWGIYQRRLL